MAISNDLDQASDQDVTTEPQAGETPRWQFDTLQLHAGQTPDPTTGAMATPIYATSSYVFKSAEHAEDLFAGRTPGNQYGRMDNPTVEAFVDRLVALEGGKAGLALASGQAATTTALLALASPGAHILFSRELFGGTFSVARKILTPWGARCSTAAPQPDAIAGAISDDTVAVWLETIANPSCTVPDLAAIAEICRARQVPLIVDNTWGCGGYLCRPLDLGVDDLGADIVVHSATKWIGGHGSFIGGAIVDAGRYDWANGKFPAFTARDSRGRSYVSRAGETAFSLRARDLGLFTMGMTLSPYAASLALQGSETLSLRVQRACDTALDLARWLEPRPDVKRVIYPGLDSHLSHDVAKKTLRHGYGAVFSFEATSLGAARAFLDRVRLASHLANIGDAKTVVINPWTTTHASLPEEDRLAAGVSPELVRVSVGLEHPADLQADFAHALAAPVPG
ncbi:MAG: PLP-dependent transferase [Trueperaceae bacterium]|nr:PLP-dependent transferase [Trueperaceae bacterium]